MQNDLTEEDSFGSRGGLRLELDCSISPCNGNPRLEFLRNLKILV
jgi:hypothetical protein